MQKKHNQGTTRIQEESQIEDVPSGISLEVDEVLKSIDSGDFFPEKRIPSPEPQNISRAGFANTLENLKDHLKGAKRCLDVGSNSGYLTLAFAKLMKQSDAVTYRIEYISGLVNEAKANIEKNHQKYVKSRKIVLVEGDVRNGLKEYAPYDVIYVESTSSIEIDELTGEIPKDFVSQLGKGGRMVIAARSFELWVVDKDENGKVTKQLMKILAESSQNKVTSESKKPSRKEQQEEQIYGVKNETIIADDIAGKKFQIAKDGRGRRILKEFTDLITNPPVGFFVQSENPQFEWYVHISGPRETPYEGGTFIVKLEIPDNYPFKPPYKVSFITKIYHPRITEGGERCLCGFDDWVPTRTMKYLIEYLISSLAVPVKPDFEIEKYKTSSFGGCYNKLVCIEYMEDRPKFNQKAKEYTIKYAMN